MAQVSYSRMNQVQRFGRDLLCFGIALACWLVYPCAFSVAQNDSIPGPVSVPEYGVPKALPSFGVTSDEFEKFIKTPAIVVPVESPIPTLPSAPNTQLAAPKFERPVSVGGVPLVQPIAPSVQPFAPLAQPFVDDRVGEDRAATGRIVPWWQTYCAEPILTRDNRQVCPVDLEQLVWQSMQFSPRVQSILIAPRIQRTDIAMAQGNFDRRRFAQSNYHDTSDPVGNTLTTGGPTRLNEQFWENSVGIRDKNFLGGKTELSQMYNARDNNSLFFKPNNQADTKLFLTYSQPLLRGAGRTYNMSAIQIAGIRTNESIAKANRELQNHAKQVIGTYWELMLQRYLLEQSKRGQDRLKSIKEHLQNRQGNDLLLHQASRASAAVANQQAQIETAKANILGLQESLKRLVNSPELRDAACGEILPLTVPVNEFPALVLEEELMAALLNRGDILAIQEELQIAVVQKGLAVNELRTQLDLDTTSYVRGLQGNNQFAHAYGDQFSTGRPSFSAGLTGQRAVGNRTAKANLKSRELEIAKIQNEYAEQLNTARADIKSAIFNAEATYASTIAAIEAVFAQRDELEMTKERFMNFMNDNSSTSNILSDLLDAENRLILAENSWANKQIQHMLALTNIKFESGTLMAITAE
jgi:outer membrane protein